MTYVERLLHVQPNARWLLVPVLVVVLATLRPVPTAAEGQIVGAVPGPGALGLVVWTGGSAEELRASLANTSCAPVSVWANRRGGGLVGYLFGAPDAVNAGFRGEYASARMPAQTPVVLVCRAGGSGIAQAPIAPAPAPTVAPTSVPTAAPTTAPSSAGMNAAEAQMLVLVNQERVARGLPQFVADPALTALARAHSADMAARSYFSHTNPDGLDPFDRMAAAGISFGNAAENIAWAPTVQWAHDALMDSPGHRANLLNPSLGRIGIGIAPKDSKSILVTQAFTN